MLAVNQLSKSFGLKQILNSVTFTVNAGERAALIGKNGCGKTTLLSIINGDLKADSGTVIFSNSDIRVGYLSQSFSFPEGDTLGGYLEKITGNINQKSKELAQFADQLSMKPDHPELQERYDSLLAEIHSSAQFTANPDALLPIFGLENIEREFPIDKLSGGQKTRLALLGTIASSPNLLILDEPTNHLDIGMLEWLETWMLSFRGGLLYTTHDRALIDRTATSILELDEDSKSIQLYAGNYSDYLEAKLAAREKHKKAYSRQQSEIARLEKAMERKQGEARYKPGGKADSDKFAKGFYKNRSSGTIRRAKMIEKRIAFLQDEGKVERLEKPKELKVLFQDIQRSSQLTLSLENAVIGYPGNVLIEESNHVIHYAEHIALTGVNGCGKSTLLKTIRGEIPPLKGTVRLAKNVIIGYLAQSHENLDPTLTVLQTVLSQAPLSETDARTMLSYFLFTGDDVFTQVEKLSLGERSRLSLANFVARGCNYLILDEPDNFLDIPSRIQFEDALANFEGTILAVTHDRFFIEGFADQVWEIEDKHIRVIK